MIVYAITDADGDLLLDDQDNVIYFTDEDQAIEYIQAQCGNEDHGWLTVSYEI